MNLWIYYNTAPKNKLDKNSDMVLKFGVVGSFRDETSITNPVIDIEIYDGQSHYIEQSGHNVLESGTYVQNLEILQRCNYVYLPDMKTSDSSNAHGRYYFINEIEHISSNNTKGLFRLYLHCDLLMSFKDYIKEQSALVTSYESSTSDDLYFNNGVLKPNVKTKTQIIESTKSNTFSETGRHVLITVSKSFTS